MVLEEAIVGVTKAIWETTTAMTGASNDSNATFTQTVETFERTYSIDLVMPLATLVVLLIREYARSRDIEDFSIRLYLENLFRLLITKAKRYCYRNIYIPAWIIKAIFWYGIATKSMHLQHGNIWTAYRVCLDWVSFVLAVIINLQHQVPDQRDKIPQTFLPFRYLHSVHFFYIATAPTTFSLTNLCRLVTGCLCYGMSSTGVVTGSRIGYSQLTGVMVVIILLIKIF